MKFWKITCSNSFCGCDEVYYEKAEENEIQKLAEDILINCYSFYDDDSFLDEYDENDDDSYREAILEYQECNCYYFYEEITKEEFLEEGGSLDE